MKYLIPVIALFLSLQSCNKSCKGCYRVEDIDGTITEYYEGEYCGSEVKDKEDAAVYCTIGTCHYECR